MGHARQAGFLALPHELPLRCVRAVELTSCVGHERQEGDAHLSMCERQKARRHRKWSADQVAAACSRVQSVQQQLSLKKAAGRQVGVGRAVLKLPCIKLTGPF